MTRIRPARLADAEAIARVYVETWRTTYAGMLPDRVLLNLSVDRQAIIWSRAIAAANVRQWIRVAETDDGSLVGFGSSGAAHGTNLAYDGEVYTLYVEPDFQEQGYGRGLLEGLFAALCENGYGAALVWVLGNNPARFFYEALGGRRVAERDEALFGTVIKEFAYGWPDLATAVAAARPDAAP